MAEREIKAAEFKAKCLQLMDEVAETGEAIVVTKRGKPVAKLVPAKAGATKPGPKFGFMKEWANGGRGLDPEETAWDEDVRAAFEDGLARTADLINAPGARKRKR